MSYIVAEQSTQWQSCANSFGVSRSGYYAFVHRLGRPGHSFCRTHRPETGTQLPYLRIPAAVAEKQKIFCTPKTVLQIMKKYDLLFEVRRPKRWKQVGQQVHKYKNLLNREFHADQPNRKWVTDISYIHTN